MDFENIRKLIEDNYDIKVNNISKRKNVYKIESTKEQYCLKVINYDFAHFYFIICAINHLHKKGFCSTPSIILTANNKKYIKINEKYAYVTLWIKTREADYKNNADVVVIAKKIAQLHKCSKGFVVNEDMSPRVYWGSWIRTFETRIEEILDFKKNINRKTYKSEFDNIFLEAIESEVERGKRAVECLKNSSYKEYMQNECSSLGFCHHDLAHHNILIDDENNANIIDFDYCILDSHLHDLASFCMRIMRNGGWNIETFDEIKFAYSSEGLSKDEELIIAGFLEFPQDFWQVGLQYYWERLSWNEERFLGRLNSYINDRKCRTKFIEELKERSR